MTGQTRDPSNEQIHRTADHVNVPIIAQHVMSVGPVGSKRTVVGRMNVNQLLQYANDRPNAMQNLPFLP